MSKDRYGIVIFFFILFFLFLVLRVISITLFPDPRLKNAAFQTARRGVILDRNGQELAQTVQLYSLYARPSRMSEPVRQSVAEAFRRNGLFTEQELAALQEDKGFVWIRRRLDRDTTAMVRQLIDYYRTNVSKFQDNLGLSPEDGRYYPYPALSGVVGMSGLDNRGLSGLEYSMNTDLAAGRSVKTTLDAPVCTMMQEELKAGVTEFSAESGSAVLVDLNSAQIIGLATYPSYNPNSDKKLTPEMLRSRVAGAIFEPGSVMKQFSAAYALERGTSSPETPVYYCPGAAEAGGEKITCTGIHGQVTLSRIIQKSCNVGMVQVADRFEREGFYQFLRSLGFGRPTQLPLGESEDGILRPSAKWSAVSRYMIAIGQEIGVTAVQLAAACSAIGAGGVYRPLQLVTAVTDQSGNYWTNSTEATRVLRPENARTLMRMMETVVSEKGTAIAAQIEGITIAGKTGTGQVAREGGGGYYPDLYNSVFAGYLPAEAPKYALIVVIHRPHGEERTGGIVAAPVFSSIVRRMISGTTYRMNEAGVLWPR